MKTKTDLSADQLPLGTKAFAFDGGHWLRVPAGWKWQCVGDVGSTFPTPGADWQGLVELPEGAVRACSRRGCPEPYDGPCAQCDSRY